MKATFFCAVAGLALCLFVACDQTQKETRVTVETAQGTEPATTEESVTPPPNEAAIVKTSVGEMVIQLWPDAAPNTVANFTKLAREGFYNGTAFHRIMRHLIIQGGCPETKNPDPEAQHRWGTGDPGYKIKAEFNDRSHLFGVISMALEPGDPDSAGSQFFICLRDADFYDGQFTAFGQVIGGEEVLRKIGNTPTTFRGGGRDRERTKPLMRVEIESIEIVPSNSMR